MHKTKAIQTTRKQNVNTKKPIFKQHSMHFLKTINNNSLSRIPLPQFFEHKPHQFLKYKSLSLSLSLYSFSPAIGRPKSPNRLERALFLKFGACTQTLEQKFETKTHCPGPLV